FLAAGPEHGFWGTWTPGGARRGDLGPWTYRVVDVVMYGHKYSTDGALRSRCLKAAEDAFEFMERRYPGPEPLYYDSKFHTILAGGGHEYTFFKKNGGWKK
ncbi:MAG TPA: hypothetical protein VJ417_12015, partial [Candidatus Glassbacteria bacterium]|nr:hypothetical protein [Candidatus Glassbacteria bacterium]